MLFSLREENHKHLVFNKANGKINHQDSKYKLWPNSNSFGFHTNMLPSLINECIIIIMAIAVITYQTFDDPMQKELKAWMFQQIDWDIEIDNTNVLLWVTQRNKKENVIEVSIDLQKKVTYPKKKSI